VIGLTIRQSWPGAIGGRLRRQRQGLPPSAHDARTPGSASGGRDRSMTVTRQELAA